MHIHQYRAVFAGRTAEEEKIVLYVDREDRFHISVADGDLQAISINSKLEWWYNHIEHKAYCTIESPQWSGTACGYKSDLLEMEDI